MSDVPAAQTSAAALRPVSAPHPLPPVNSTGHMGLPTAMQTEAMCKAGRADLLLTLRYQSLHFSFPLF